MESKEPTSAPSDLKMYTTEEIAESFKVEIATVRRWIRDGKLKGIKLGGHHWRVSETELRRFANAKLEE